MVVESGDVGNIVFQAAEVRKPLLSVWSVNQKGNPVWFDGELSYIVAKNAECLSAVRKMLQEIPNKIPLHNQNGVFTMKAWRKPVNSDKNTPFHGPGKK